MPKCLECGAVLPRLQWTHFKYKCTGRFSNGSEYKTVYPDAKLVDDEIAKKTTLTLENFIKKYGEEDGLKRWNEYRERQAYSNSFEFKNKKHGWSKDEYDLFNKSRAVTLDNLVKKYGQKIAEEKFNDYCERQAYTCSIDYFTKTYGEDEGNRKYNNFAKTRAYVATANTLGVSKVEYDVLNELKNICPEIEHQFIIDGCYFGPYDFGSNEHKKVIEFYGSYWHCDPRVYDDDYYHTQIGKHAQQIRKHDSNKRNYAMRCGYEVFVIWELDWYNNRNDIINNLNGWWNGNNSNESRKD